MLYWAIEQSAMLYWAIEQSAMLYWTIKNCAIFVRSYAQINSKWVIINKACCSHCP